MTKNKIDLAAYFEIVADIEANLEDQKIMLVREHEDFNTIDMFRIMDQSGIGVVSKEILHHFMIENLTLFQVTNPEIDLFLRRFDKLRRQQLKYS